jgi:hypothetical protein
VIFTHLRSSGHYPVLKADYGGAGQHGFTSSIRCFTSADP